jgi:methylamine dehydrogenase heavy chain
VYASVGRGAQTEAPASVAPGGAHRIWVPDRIWHHSVLFDGDTAHVIGMVDAPYATVTPKLPMHAHHRGEIYSVDLAYSRGDRGERVDFITIYDDRTLSVTGEILLPTHTGDANSSIAYAALLDGERFVASFNQFPIASVSITDVEKRRFVGEVTITGCAGVFPTGERSFATLCGDGRSRRSSSTPMAAAASPRTPSDSSIRSRIR